MVTDAITNWFFTTSEVANANLRRAGVADERIFFVGNTMIDTLLKQMPRLRAPEFWGELGLQPGRYFVVTLHRPANVDGEQQLLRLLRAIAEGTGGLPVVFPVHPTTGSPWRSWAVAPRPPRAARPWRRSTATLPMAIHGPAAAARHTGWPMSLPREGSGRSFWLGDGGSANAITAANGASNGSWSWI